MKIFNAGIEKGTRCVPYRTAHNLLEQFGSVEAVLAADEQALLSVAGIASGRAKAIRWAVGEQWAGHGIDKKERGDFFV